MFLSLVVRCLVSSDEQWLDFPGLLCRAAFAVVAPHLGGEWKPLETFRLFAPSSVLVPSSDARSPLVASCC